MGAEPGAIGVRLVRGWALWARSTKLRFGTGVTPPGYRYHPAILAQAAATLEAMYPGRFYLGLGAGEALNEHITGEYWPEAPTRLERLAESIEIIQKLFTGKVVKYRGAHFNVESARLYTLPDAPPPIYIATSGPINAKRTGKTTDGIILVGAADDKLKMLLGAVCGWGARGRQGPGTNAEDHPVQGLAGRDRG